MIMSWKQPSKTRLPTRKLVDRNRARSNIIRDIGSVSIFQRGMGILDVEQRERYAGANGERHRPTPGASPWCDVAALTPNQRRSTAFPTRWLACLPIAISYASCEARGVQQIESIEANAIGTVLIISKVLETGNALHQRSACPCLFLLGR